MFSAPGIGKGNWSEYLWRCLWWYRVLMSVRPSKEERDRKAAEKKAFILSRQALTQSQTQLNNGSEADAAGEEDDAEGEEE